MTIKKVQLADAEILRALAERTFRDAWQDENEPEAFEQYCREHFSTETVKAELAAPDTEFYFTIAQRMIPCRCCASRQQQLFRKPG